MEKGGLGIVGKVGIYLVSKDIHCRELMFTWILHYVLEYVIIEDDAI